MNVITYLLYDSLNSPVARDLSKPYLSPSKGAHVVWARSPILVFTERELTFSFEICLKAEIE